MSAEFAFTADFEGPPRRRFYIYRTEPQSDGGRSWMFTADDYDSLGRSNPLAEVVEPTFEAIRAHPERYSTGALEWRRMAGGDPVDLDDIAEEVRRLGLDDRG